MTSLMRNRVKVLKGRIFFLAVSNPKDDLESFSGKLLETLDFLDSILEDVQKPTDEQPDYDFDDFGCEVGDEG